MGSSRRPLAAILTAAAVLAGMTSASSAAAPTTRETAQTAATQAAARAAKPKRKAPKHKRVRIRIAVRHGVAGLRPDPPPIIIYCWADAFEPKGLGDWNIRGKGAGTCPASPYIAGFTVHAAVAFGYGSGKFYPVSPSHLSKYKRYGYSTVSPAVDCGTGGRYFPARIKTRVTVDTRGTGQGKIHADVWGPIKTFLCGDADGE